MYVPIKSPPPIRSNVFLLKPNDSSHNIIYHLQSSSSYSFLYNRSQIVSQETVRHFNLYLPTDAISIRSLVPDNCWTWRKTRRRAVTSQCRSEISILDFQVMRRPELPVRLTKYYINKRLFYHFGKRLRECLGCQRNSNKYFVQFTR